MDRSIMRRRLGVLAIVIAGLAAAATSPSPTATPDLSSRAEGTLTVTDDHPVAWVDLRADENDALASAEGTTTIRVESFAGPAVFLIVQDLSRVENRTEGQATVALSATCPPIEPCEAILRLTAILLDPAGEPSVDVNFYATAESRFQAGKGPIPGAVVAVDPGDVESRSAEAFGMVALPPDVVAVGPDVPRAVRNVHVTLPSGPTDGATVAPGLLIRLVDRADTSPYEPPVFAHLPAEVERVDIRWPTTLINPFAACPPLEPCEVDLPFTFDWNGGSADGAAIDWSIVAWPGVGDDEPVAAPIIDPPVTADITWEDPGLSASLSGTSEVTQNGGANVALDAALDLSAVAQRFGDLEGLLRMTVHAKLADGTDPAPEIRLSVDAAASVGLVRVGEEIVGYSRAGELVCEPRSVCPMQFFIGLYGNSGELPEATVEWTADIEFLPPGSGEVPEGAALTLTRPTPSP